MSSFAVAVDRLFRKLDKDKDGIELKRKKYMARANETLPADWMLVEATRIADTSGCPTFSIFLEIRSGESYHIWPVIVDMPRRILRKFVENVERDGVYALINPDYPTYTSRFDDGVSPAVLGLREFIMRLPDVVERLAHRPKKEVLVVNLDGESEIDRMLK